MFLTAFSVEMRTGPQLGRARQSGRVCKPLFLRPAAEEQRREIAEDQRRRGAGGRGGEAALEDTERAVLGDGAFHAAGNRRAEAAERQGRAAPGKADEPVVDAERAEQHAGRHIQHENARRGQHGPVDEELCGGAERAADEKGEKIGGKIAHGTSFWRIGIFGSRGTAG